MEDNKIQTINFFNLQLNLFQFSSQEIRQLYYIIRTSNIYEPNEHTKKLDDLLLFNSPSLPNWLNEKDIECIATHLAMQLSGLEV